MQVGRLLPQQLGGYVEEGPQRQDDEHVRGGHVCRRGVDARQVSGHRRPAAVDLPFS